MKKFLKTISIPALLSIPCSLFFRKWLEVSENFAIVPIKNNCRLLHVSDLHGYSFGKNNQKIKDIVLRIKPDFICITGDYLNADGREMSPALDLLSFFAGHSTVIYVPGNHELSFKKDFHKEYRRYIENINKMGVIFLDDTSYYAENYGICFYGYTNKAKEYKKFRPIYRLCKEEIAKSLSYPDKTLSSDGKTCYNILLAHNPMNFKAYAEWGADLVLSGHLHGGIVRLPFIGGILSPQTFLGTRYSGGKYSYKNSMMYVSRGLGLHTIHFRLFNRPELVVHQLIKE